MRNEETQHFAARALKVHSLLVVILEKRLGAAALPQTEGSSLLSLSGGGQSPSSTFCAELATFTPAGGCDCFVNGARQVLSTPEYFSGQKGIQNACKAAFWVARCRITA